VLRIWITVLLIQFQARLPKLEWLDSTHKQDVTVIPQFNGNRLPLMRTKMYIPHTMIEATLDNS